MAEDRKSDVFGEAMLRIADARMRREIEQPGSTTSAAGEAETDAAADIQPGTDASPGVRAAPLSAFDAAA